MKKIFFILFISIISVLNVGAQIQVDNSQTVEWFVKNVLLGTGVDASNITFSGDLMQIGSFTNGSTTNLGINDGLILSTGGINTLVGPNISPGYSISVINNNHTENDLSKLIPQTLFDPAILEFDFIPKGDNLEFEYVFGSDEYPNYVNKMNDVFGFFLSGPGINGTFTNNADNIALIPGTTDYVSINNVHNANAIQGYPAKNGAFFVDNTSGTTIQYNGFTTVLKATAKVKPCQLYHIKLVIADAGDEAYDSGVCLKGGSFSSHAIGVSQKYSSKSGLEAAIEGCSDATIEFDAGYDVQQDTLIKYSLAGTPQNGIDYQSF